MTANCQDLGSYSIGDMSNYASIFLWKLPFHVQQYVNQHNAATYLHYIQGKYNSIQIRLSDKKAEMNEKTWNWMTHTANIAKFVEPIFEQSGLRHVFISSDNCTAVVELEALLPKYQFITPCRNITTGHINTENPRKEHDHFSVLQLIAEIEMLRNGEHFIGLFDSNLVRMIHRLRFPDKLNTSHALAADTYEEASRRSMNSNMEFMPIMT